QSASPGGPSRVVRRGCGAGRSDRGAVASPGDHRPARRSDGSLATMTSRRALLTGAAAGTAALALAGRRARAAALVPERRIGFALVGIGKLTQGQLIPALRSTKIARLTALVSGHADKAKRVAAAEGVPERSIYSYETFDRLADNPDVDVVYIVLPNSMHAEYSIRAARAGKHVYCEKPMAITAAECDQMIAA